MYMYMYVSDLHTEKVDVSEIMKCEQSCPLVLGPLPIPVHAIYIMYILCVYMYVSCRPVNSLGVKGSCSTFQKRKNVTREVVQEHISLEQVMEK